MNNVCEQALKKAILHRKNAYFYKTENGAHVGDLFMSLIHTCELNGVNPFDYLRYVLGEYLQHYHHERIHQGLHRIIEPQHEGCHGEIICIERLGGLLKSYHHKAA